MDNIRILQLGNRDWSQEYTIPEGVEFFYNVIEDDDKKLYDLLFLDRNIEREELDLLRKLTKAYTVFVIPGFLHRRLRRYCRKQVILYSSRICLKL